MAEKKESGEKTVLDKGEKRDRILTNFSVAAILAYVGRLLFDRLTQKGVEHVTKKVEAKLGLGTEEARESFVDESVYLENVLTEELGEEDAKRALNFEEDLRREHPQLAEAYVLALAKLHRQFKEDGSRPGDASVVKLIQILLQLDTFEERVAFIKGRGIEALISPPKTDLLQKLSHANFDGLKQEARKLEKQFQDQLKKDPYRGFWKEALGIKRRMP